jgi:hypothetical protein
MAFPSIQRWLQCCDCNGTANAAELCYDCPYCGHNHERCGAAGGGAMDEDPATDNRNHYHSSTKRIKSGRRRSLRSVARYHFQAFQRPSEEVVQKPGKEASFVQIPEKSRRRYHRHMCE